MTTPTPTPTPTQTLPTDELRIAFSAEAKSWKVIYGRNMNTKYFSMMEKIMEQIDGINKKLQRPVKDLDDVRMAMASLKEIRENETTIDSSLGPIEVSNIATFTTTYHFALKLHCRNLTLC